MPQCGEIRDSHATLVRAFLTQWSIVPEQRRGGEDEAAIDSVLGDMFSATDLLPVSGGASLGEHDFMHSLLREAGFTIYVRKTAARPGRPLIVAQRGGTPALGPPGNPLAHCVCLNLYVRAALERFAGRGAESTFQSGTLAPALASGVNARETVWPAQWELRDGVAMLTPLRWSSSGDLASLATAHAPMAVSAGAAQFLRGSLVECVRTERSS
jgi:molybdopterin molybdotransferase